jgi:hypothetical protein
MRSRGQTQTQNFERARSGGSAPSRPSGGVSAPRPSGGGGSRPSSSGSSSGRRRG